MAYRPVGHHGTVNCRGRSGDSILRCYERPEAVSAARGLFAAFAHVSGHLLPLKSMCARCGFLHWFAVVTFVDGKRLMASLLTCAFVANREVNG